MQHIKHQLTVQIHLRTKLIIKLVLHALMKHLRTLTFNSMDLVCRKASIMATIKHAKISIQEQLECEHITEKEWISNQLLYENRKIKRVSQ